MTAASGVPPVLRPVLEALRDAARWMRVEVTNEHEAHAAACKQRVAWLDLEGCCARLLAAALASDAEKTQGELCPECGGTGGFGPGGFCPNSGEWQGEVCEECGGTGKPREPAAAPPTNAPEISMSLVDAELDRLISEYGRAHARAMEHMSWPNDTPQCRAAIHAHVARVKREARGKARAAAYAEITVRRDNERREKEEGFDLIQHLHRQRAFSERTFGPGARVAGVIDHIRRELLEVEEHPSDLTEWVDVILLALDGAWRSGASPEQIAAAIAGTQGRNELRKWPDWRTADPDKAIQHVRREKEEG